MSHQPAGATAFPPPGIRIEFDPPEEPEAGGPEEEDGASDGSAAVAVRRKPQQLSHLMQLSPPARSRRSRSLPSVHGDLEGDQLEARLRDLSIQQQQQQLLEEQQRSSLTERLPEPAQKLAIDSMPLPVDNSRQRRKSFDFSVLQNLGSIQEQD